jgi:hypothetical protein
MPSTSAVSIPSVFLESPLLLQAGTANNARVMIAKNEIRFLITGGLCVKKIVEIQRGGDRLLIYDSISRFQSYLAIINPLSVCLAKYFYATAI